MTDLDPTSGARIKRLETAIARGGPLDDETVHRLRRLLPPRSAEGDDTGPGAAA